MVAAGRMHACARYRSPWRAVPSAVRLAARPHRARRALVARAELGREERGRAAGRRPCPHIRVEHTRLKNSTQRATGAKKGQARAVRWFEARMEVLFVAKNTCASSSIMPSDVIIFCMCKNDCMVVSTKPHTSETPKMPWSLAAKSRKRMDSYDATIASAASFTQNICRPP